jgi:hypothetical protein
MRAMAEAAVAPQRCTLSYLPPIKEGRVHDLRGDSIVPLFLIAKTDGMFRVGRGRCAALGAYRIAGLLFEVGIEFEFTGQPCTVAVPFTKNAHVLLLYRIADSGHFFLLESKDNSFFSNILSLLEGLYACTSLPELATSKIHVRARSVAVAADQRQPAGL